MPKPTAGKHPTFLKEKATGNHALDAYAYGPWPHLFNRLALEYEPPESLMLTLLFLWDRTVGSGEGCGDCALSQIHVRDREKAKWLAAFVASNFFECVKAKSGGTKQSGSFYAYNNPTADEWDEFFRRAGILKKAANWDKIRPEKFGKLFADIRGEGKKASAVGWAFLELLEDPRERTAVRTPKKA